MYYNFIMLILKVLWECYVWNDEHKHGWRNFERLSKRPCFIIHLFFSVFDYIYGIVVLPIITLLIYFQQWGDDRLQCYSSDRVTNIKGSKYSVKS